jgi:hypothetical protein
MDEVLSTQCIFLVAVQEIRKRITETDAMNFIKER